MVYRRGSSSRRWKASKMRLHSIRNRGDPHSDVKTFAVISLRDCEERNKKYPTPVPPPCASHFTVATIPRRLQQLSLSNPQDYSRHAPDEVRCEITRVPEYEKKKIYRSWRKRKRETTPTEGKASRRECSMIEAFPSPEARRIEEGETAGKGEKGR